MKNADRRLWPFGPRISLIAAAVLLIGLLFLLAVLRAILNWPGQNSENAVLIGVLVLSLLPVLLSILDTIIDRGAVIEYAGVKIDFSEIRRVGMPAVAVPVNIGVRGQPVTDSGTTQILDALRHATSCDVAIIDLEEGQAWWETRLLVLVAGAERLQKPQKIVFVGTDGRKPKRFQGWAHANELLAQLLLQGDPQYRRSLQAARAAARQWELVEPMDPALPGQTAPAPPQPPWITGRLAKAHSWMAFGGATGLRNEMLAEQLLASDLGQKLEIGSPPKTITLVRLQELFRPTLRVESIDQSWPTDQQMSALFSGDETHIAVTQDGSYLTMTSRLTLLGELLKGVIRERPT